MTARIRRMVIDVAAWIVALIWAWDAAREMRREVRKIEVAI